MIINIDASRMTYQELQREAMIFLAHCGELTLIEYQQQGIPAGTTSSNEILGMATRVIAEQAKEIQLMADDGEIRRAG
jgi:hypothetical protein